MKKPKFKIFGYGFYFSISFGLLISLFLMRNQYNWVAGGLREIFTYALIGFSTVFLLIMTVIYLRWKSNRTVFLGLIGIFPCIMAIPFLNAPIFGMNNSLYEKVETIELTYIAWACDCANWATIKDLKNYADNFGDTLARRSIFVEPAHQSLELPDTLGYSNDIIKFTGQFYIEKGFPKGYQSFENPENARVFRYTEYEVVKSNYKEYKE